jgi:putative drug exporter of the RND superfamily
MVDAVVARAVVLPSIMTLLGRANWWPTQPFAETPVFRHDTPLRTEELASRH